MAKVEKIFRVEVTDQEVQESMRQMAIDAIVAADMASVSEVDALDTANILFRDTTDGHKAIILDPVKPVEEPSP